MKNEQQQTVHYIHSMKYSMQEKIVGLFVLFALASFFTLLVINTKKFTFLFDQYISLNINITNAEGISRETQVRISGINVGRVDEVEVTEDNRILITLRVYERYRGLLRTDSTAAIGRLSLLGRPVIEISAGSPELPKLFDGATLMVEEPFSIDQLLSDLTSAIQGIDGAAQSFTAIMAAVDPCKLRETIDTLMLVSRDFQEISSSVTGGQGALGMAIYDDEFQKSIFSSLKNLETTLDTAGQSFKQIDPILKNADRISREVDIAAAHLPELITETRQVLQNINTGITSLNIEIMKMPDMIVRMNLLMEQTDRLLQGVSDSWLFSGGDSRDRDQLIGVQPHD